MKILYIAEDISLPGFHGGSTHVQETINALKELKHDIWIICKIKKGQKTRETKDRINYIRLAIPKNSILKNEFLFFNLGGIAEKIIKDEHIDLVWQRNRIFGNQGIIVGKKLGKKTLLEMNEPIDTSENSFYFPLIKKWFYHSSKYADKIYGTHQVMFRNLPKNKTFIVSWASNPKLFNPKRKDSKISKKYNLQGKTLFYSGSFQEWHKLKKAILAFEKVKNEFPEASFLLAGNGNQKEELEDFVKERDIQEIHFLGNIDYEKLAHYINASDVCLALFDRESGTIKKLGYFYSPIKVHDCKACGKPIVASSIGNLKKLIKDNKNGLLVDERNVDEIANAIEKLFKDKKLVSKINSNNLKEATTVYTWKNITKKILSEIK